MGQAGPDTFVARMGKKWTGCDPPGPTASAAYGTSVSWEVNRHWVSALALYAWSCSFGLCLTVVQVIRRSVLQYVPLCTYF